MHVNVNGRSRRFRTVDYDIRRNAVRLIDQRLLPHQFRLLTLRNHSETARAIREMAVRGAGAIGATAAFGLTQGTREFMGSGSAAFHRWTQKVYRTLETTRPTAVDLVNAMTYVLTAMRSGKTVQDCQARAVAAARAFAETQVEQCKAIGRHGAPLIRPRARILTHCNAGWLAFVDVGSATAPMYAAQELRRSFHVYCDETRPRLQGAALTAWELAQQGISHQVIADNAAGHLMQRGDIDLVIVGSDRVVGRTGEVANKIGTYTKAVLAARHGIPFYVAIPLSTIDWRIPSGAAIPIEERDEQEVLGAWGMSRSGRRLWVRTANPRSSARNPGFDVTPPDLITGLITPAGLVRPDELWNRRREFGIEIAGRT